MIVISVTSNFFFYRYSDRAARWAHAPMRAGRLLPGRNEEEGGSHRDAAKSLHRDKRGQSPGG